jgi:prepilin-type processing-associated H-X9-DG protein
VVLAIIGLLVALLLPAVQAAREAARSTRCKNNLHQMAVALQNYHDVDGAFPPAFIARPRPYRPGWSWSSMLLPFLEQPALYDALDINTTDFGAGADFAPATPTTQTTLPAFVCPSDTGPWLNHRKWYHAKSNYRSVMGNINILTFFYHQLINENGAIYANSAISIAHISDGSSNTLALGECMLETNASGKRGALWAGMRGELDGILRVSDASWWVNSEPDWHINGPGEQAFSSRHPGGVHFAFSDGSIRFLHESISGATLDYLAARADGQVLAGF